MEKSSKNNKQSDTELKNIEAKLQRIIYLKGNLQPKGKMEDT